MAVFSWRCFHDNAAVAHEGGRTHGGGEDAGNRVSILFFE